MKVKNCSNSVIWIGDFAINPGKVAELKKEQLNLSGVKALLKSGELKAVEEKAKKEKKKKSEKKEK